MKKLLVLALAVICFSCEKKNEARKALLDSGFHPIKVGGYGWADCSKDDVYRTRFTAYSQDSSRVVTGCVCQGFWKGKTIRLD